MRAHTLQHVPFEGLGSIAPWLAAAGYDITATRFFESAELPDVDEIDLLVVMGGPMSVNDEERFPWLAAEKRFIQAAIQAGKPVLGVCLGAQLIASAAGARVFANPQKEIGWFPVEGIDSGSHMQFHFPPLTTVFHWHGETFDLPTGAVRLARSDACPNQAFQLGRSVIGLQFHLETTPASARDMVTNCHAELIPAEFVQSEEHILAADAQTYQSINRLMGDVLTFLLQKGETV